MTKLALPIMLAGLVLAPLANRQSPGTAYGCPPPSAQALVTPGSVLPAARSILARCVRGDLDEGRWRDAAERLARAQHAGAILPDVERAAWHALVLRLEATMRVDIGAWTTLIDAVFPHEDALPWVGPLVRGVAAARASWARQDAALQQRARAELAHLEGLARAAGPVSEAELARLLVQGAIAGAQYERDDMQLLLEAAHDLETRLLPGDDALVPVVLSRELEADLLRLTDRYAAASERYRDLLVERPRRVQSRIGLADAWRRLGRVREAEAAIAEASNLWAAADEEARATIK